MNRAEDAPLKAAPAEPEGPADAAGYEALVAALRQREAEVLLAAQLGNALLLENRQLREEYGDSLEELEQDRYALRLRLEHCRAEWEVQVSDLEQDVSELKAQVERLTHGLMAAERGRSHDQQEHQEQQQRLRDQLHTAMEVERAVSSELQALKQDAQEKRSCSPQEEELLGAMREQVLRLSQKEKVLQQRLDSVCQENAELRENLSSLHTQINLQEQRSQQQIQQLVEEVQRLQEMNQDLRLQVQQLQEEEASLQHPGQGDTSLLSELELSMDNLELWPDREQVTRDVLSMLDLLSPVPCQDDGLQGMLVHLRRVVEGLVEDLNGATVAEKGGDCGNAGQIRELRDQVARLNEENVQMKQSLDGRGPEEELLQQALRDRDEAISKKTAVEMELVRSRNDLMNLNNQLLEAVQRKLELSQELEAWQEDIQVIINQQLRSQQQSEQTRPKAAAHPLSFLRRSRRLSSTSSCASEPSSERSRAAWRDWLKRGK
ncbi:BICD family-like cargo adapter 1 [Denticeps clupeoides]|nr:BICD family-like cargo adapter 1 [Denticeps clupeoides]